MFFSVLVLACQAFGQADLNLQISGSSAVASDSLSQYQIRIANLGNVVVRNASLNLVIPQGAQITSMSVSGIHSQLVTCGLQSGKLVCSLARVFLGLGNALYVSFTLKAPSFSANYNLNAVGAHGLVDRNLANNSSSIAVSVTAPVVILPPPPPAPIVNQIVINAGETLTLSSCTGASPSTPFSQCSSSQIEFGNLTFLAGGVIDTSFDPSLTASYIQQSSSEISMTVRDAVTQQAITVYTGSSISATCFEGMAVDPVYGPLHAFRLCR